MSRNMGHTWGLPEKVYLEKQALNIYKLIESGKP